MNTRAFQMAVGLLGVACAAFLLWLWRGPAETIASADAPAAATPSPPANPPAISSAIAPHDPSPSAAIRRLLEELVRSLGRRDTRPNEAVLTFKDDAALRRFLDRAHGAGLTVLARIEALRSVRVRFEDAAQLRDEVGDNAADYAAAGANALVMIPQPPAAENRPPVEQAPFGNQTLAFLGASGNADWGRGVTVAILDTGVAPDTTFGARLHRLDIGLGTTPGTGSADGHGTGVAALAAGAASDAAGVAPGANILSIRVTDTTGVSDLFTLSQGIVAAADAGAKVINISLGGYATASVLDAALDYARERGALVVAAAGNDQAAQLTWPAADRRVVSVAAVDAAGQQVSFSNSSEQLQVSAPGYRVQTAWLDGQRAYVSGTSASAPLVAGAIAAVMSQHPGLGAADAAQIVLKSTSEAGPAGSDPAFGSGILNVGWAMNRTNTAYVDTAIATHLYDAEKNQVQVIVQNRSGRPVTGMTMDVSASNLAMKYHVPSLSPGETWTARVPADAIALRNSGSLTIRTELSNPADVEDRIPSNNKRTSVITPPPVP